MKDVGSEGLPPADDRRPTRRRLLGASITSAVAGAAAGAVGYAVSSAAASPVPSPSPAPLDAAVPFHGAHQAGITTPAQDRMHFVALDVVTRDRDELVEMLRRWTRAAERMTLGAEAAPGGVGGGGRSGVPQDTGEAYGLPASALTVTIGFGPSLFDDRFGLTDRRPDVLQTLPAFAGDQLDPRRSDGDICIQACANDPQVAVHAVRNLVRLGFGVVSVRWSQLGFGRTSSTSTAQTTARNLFGFKDGTNNLKVEEASAIDEHVWVSSPAVSSATSWMDGGSYLVARRIRMHIEVWDRTTLQEQEGVIGRGKAGGAPLGLSGEFDEPDFSRIRADGEPAIPAASHIALASPHHLGGIRILRRGYNFTDGSDGVGHLDAGLFFLAFMRDPQRQFVPMQRALADKDLLNEYIEHDGSAVFACPPGVAPGGFWGQGLFT